MVENFIYHKNKNKCNENLELVVHSVYGLSMKVVDRDYYENNGGRGTGFPDSCSLLLF